MMIPILVVRPEKELGKYVKLAMWMPPPISIMKFNVDASVCEENQV